MRKLLLGCLCSALLTSGCATLGPPSPIHTIDSKSVAAVQAEIKRQVSVYMRSAEADRIKRNRTKLDPRDYWCGSGALDFEIIAIKIDLLTSQENISKANVGLKIPVSAFTIAPSATHSYDATNVEELVYNEWLLSSGAAPDATFIRSLAAGKEKPAPLAQILLDLRTGLIDASKKSPPGTPPNGPQSCFSAYNQLASKAGDDPGDTIKVAFTAVTDNNGGVNLDLGVVSLGGSLESKVTGTSTLTASFREVGSAKLKPCDADKSKICDSAGPHKGDDTYIYRVPPGTLFPNGIPLPPAPPASDRGPGQTGPS